ncbi:MAG TPA: hypothetical protein VFQ12_01120 [Thermoleophilaceae bacterium]|nr:hypothetical protein [Thermoleophilaceae bacterium]
MTPRDRGRSLESYLSLRTKTARGGLKRRLLAAGLKRNQCERCGIEDWRGRPLTIALHHVNGDCRDNRLENIAFLCPNCHSQTDSFGGRNVGRRTQAAWSAQSRYNRA